MATVKVSALAAKTSPSGSEELLINDGGTSKKMTIANAFTDTNTNQLTTFTVSATTDTTATTISQGDDLMIAAGTGITTETTADGTVTITNTVSSASTATSSVAGIIKIEDDTDQTVAANTVSATAGKTYGVQLNSSDQAVVNVPWTDTDTTYSVGDGGLTQVNFTTADNTKLDGIEASADVTDATNVTAAGALMDSEVTNLAAVKAFATTDYATAAQGTTADAALPKAGGALTGAVTTNSTFDGVDIATRDGVLTTTTTTANAALPKAGGTMTGAITTLSITETETTKTASFTPNLSTEGTIFDVSGTITITMPTATAGKAFTIIDSGSGTLSWAGTIKWASGTVPTASGICIYSFVSNGTDWYGMQAGSAFA